jgi:hypothetical protein
MPYYYGPWEQPADYELVPTAGMVQGLNSERSFAMRQGSRGESHADFATYSQDHMNIAVAGTSPTGWTPWPEPPLISGLFEWTWGTDTIGPGATYSAVGLSIGWGYHAYDLRRQVPAPPLPWPSGAVSYQWETSPPVATVISAELPQPAIQHTNNQLGPWEAEVYAFWPSADRDYLDIRPGTTTGAKPGIYWWDAGEALYSATEVNPTAYGRLLASSIAQPHGTVDELPPIDLSPHLVGEDGAVFFMRRLRLVADVGEPQGGSAVGGMEPLGWEPRYRLRPPRLRWVYEWVPSLPPTRVFPRDDGLLTSTAGRVWPPPRSRQRSARVGPGSYT